MKRRVDWTRERVWVLGASSGIGHALAYLLAAKGADLILSARESSRFHASVESCRSVSSQAVEAVPLDLSRVDEATRVAETLVGEEAPGAAVTTVIYAAGVSQRARLIDTTDSVLEAVTNVNLRSAQAIAAIAGRRMARDGAGRLVFVSSLAAYAPTPLRGAYSAAKSGLNATAATLRAELAPHGVEVLLVIPGFVRTAISENALRGDGSTHKVMDPSQQRGMEPDTCGGRILRGIERRRAEIWVALGLKGRLALALGRIAPRLQRRVLAATVTAEPDTDGHAAQH